MNLKPKLYEQVNERNKKKLTSSIDSYHPIFSKHNIVFGYNDTYSFHINSGSAKSIKKGFLEGLLKTKKLLANISR